MKSEQTSAVEWLFEKLWEEPKDKLTWHSILKQAKEMEKEQIIDAYRKGKIYQLENSELYYNQTYKSK